MTTSPRSTPNPPATRLDVIVARNARRAVVFRRGPSREVLLSSWDLARDVLVHGQWLRGRIYTQRADLSPSGEYLVYFAAKHRGRVPAWTAVSRPPFLSAVVLFAKRDCWGGGGLFVSEHDLALNHAREEQAPHESSLQPRRFRISPLGEHSGRGEDGPIFHRRMTRDGFELRQRAKEAATREASRLWIRFDPVGVYARPHPRIAGLELERRLLGMGERGGPWEVLEYAVVDRHGDRGRELGRCDWADWDANGDLLFAKDGCLVRTPLDRRGTLGEPKLVADLRPLTFSAIAAPPEALR